MKRKQAYMCIWCSPVVRKDKKGGGGGNGDWKNYWLVETVVQKRVNEHLDSSSCQDLKGVMFLQIELPRQSIPT